jgi:RNA polymerase sigma-70 factor (ECF subfamily)
MNATAVAVRERAPNDAELVARVLGGDDAAYGLLVRRYRDRYVAFARRMLASPDDADEALQEAFVRAHRSLARCDEPARFGAWLLSILANECRSIQLRHTRRRRWFAGAEDLRTIAVPPSGDGDGWREEVECALARLEPSQREAFLLKHVEDLSYEEMAKITGAGESALKMRVKRACARLRELLREADHV